MSTTPAPYTPELGQAAFGAPWQEYSMPSFVRAGLAVLGEATASESSTGADPTGNTGASFENDIFALRAYDWGWEDSTEECPPNFEYKPSGFSASWYKYLGRGSTVSGRISPKAFARLLAECLASLSSGGVRSTRETLVGAMSPLLPVGAFADAAVESNIASLQIWLPWPAGVDPAPDPDPSSLVARYVAAIEAALGPALAASGWAFEPGDGEFHLTAPFPPLGDGSPEDAAAAACYRELGDAELRAAGWENPGEAIWFDRLVLVAHSGINIFRTAHRQAN